jgi:pSer/pThr/pTyr-binding forkhead associated (FHA) protein
MNDASISRQHAQFSRQASGDYVQDLTSRNGTLVNNEPLTGPRLLQHGDRICLGTIELQYTAAQHAPRTPMPQIITPRSFARSMSGPVPLKLPSKQKESH